MAVATASKYGILVVDDELILRHLLQAVLQQDGFDVWVAASGREALDAYQRHLDAIGVVLLDVQMPDLDGPRTLTALQRLNPEVRCCFMTGSSGKYTEEELLARGAANVFVKPFDLEKVTEELVRLAGAIIPGVRNQESGVSKQSDPSRRTADR